MLLILVQSVHGGPCQFGVRSMSSRTLSDRGGRGVHDASGLFFVF